MNRGGRVGSLAGRILGTETGQGVVETVLVLPLLLILALVIMDGTQLLLADISLTSTARAAVVAAVTDLDRGRSAAQALVDARLAARAQGLAIACGAGRSCVALSSTPASGSRLPLEMARVEDTVHLVFPDVGPITIRAQATAAPFTLGGP